MISDEMWQEVRAAYATPGRAYHTFEHVLEVQARWEEVAHDVGWAHPRATLLAVLYVVDLITMWLLIPERRGAELQ